MKSYNYDILINGKKYYNKVTFVGLNVEETIIGPLTLNFCENKLYYHIDGSLKKRIKEIKFFSDPKTVKKKTQGSILTFQIAFSVLFCLFYKLTQLLAPELYHNISTYLERLFGW